MTKKPQKTEAIDSATATGAAVMQQLEDAGLGPLHWMGTAWFEKMSDMNNQILGFMAERIKEDVETQQALLQCKGAEDLQRTQLAFMEKAHAQYTDETGKLIKMGMDMVPVTPKTTKHTPV